MPVGTRLSLIVLTALLLSVLGGTAHAQWAWRDKDGRRVYSDTPPPASVPDKDILQQPPVSNRAGPQPELPAMPVEPSRAAAPPPPRAAASSPADKELEARRKQAEEAEVARKKAAAEQQAHVRAENCQLARQALTTLDSGMRIARVNAQGEREILDDGARSAERQRIQRVIDTDCGNSQR